MSLFEKYIAEAIENNKIHVTGVLHVGAHNAEELDFYHGLLSKAGKNQILWIEANPDKVKELKARGINNVYEAVIADKDGEKVMFNVANNTQSSSILPLGLHAIEHPDIHYVNEFEAKTVTLKTFFDDLKCDATVYNYWHLDIQGAELMALKGAGSLLKNVDIISIEVNTKEIYKGCPLISDIDEYLQNTKNLRDFGNFQRILTKISKHGWGDAVYLRKTNIPLITYENEVKSSYRIEDITQCEYVSNIGLMLLCDTTYNKNGKLVPIQITGAAARSKKQIIYIKDDDGVTLSNFIKKSLPHLKQKFILVTGGSDLTAPFEMVTKEEARTLIANPFMKKWYAQNYMFVHEKVDNWPLGLSFNLYREGRTYETPAIEQEKYLKSLISFMKPFHKRVADHAKDPLIYVNMTMRNSRLESRWDCFNAVYLKDPSLIVEPEETLRKHETATETPRNTVWQNISSTPFCLSPFGYGIDCHRHYEILALGAIPIIRGKILHRLFEDMPVLYVEKWEDITRTLLVETLKELSTQKFDYSKLKIAYWKNFLRKSSQK